MGDPLHVDGDADGAEIDEHGLLPAIVVLPAVVDAIAEALFPDDVPRAALETTGTIALCFCGSRRPSWECCAN